MEAQPAPASDRSGAGSATTSRAENPRTSAGVISERLHALADVAGLLGELEDRVHEMDRQKTLEDARRREALRALDRLGRIMSEAAETVEALKSLFGPDGSALAHAD